MFDAGTVSARLTLDRSDFAASLEWARGEARKGIEAPVTFGVSDRSAASALAAATAAFRSARVTVPVMFDAALSSLTAALAQARMFATASAVSVPVTFRVDPAAAAALGEVAVAAEAAAGRLARAGTETTSAGINAASTATLMKSLAAATDDSTAAAARGNMGWTRWGALTGTAVHWIISGAAELAAVLIPATVAGAAWAAVWIEGTANVAVHMESVYTATEAMSNMAGVTAGQMVGLGNALQQAQDKADPQVYQALGAGIRLIREQAGGIDQAGLQMSAIFDTFAARLVYDFSSAGHGAQQMHDFLQSMVPDLTRVGETFGSLGAALVSVGTQMPGLAELLLHLIADTMGAADAASNFIGQYKVMGWSLLTAAMAVEEFMRWGGLLVTLMGKMGIATVDVGDKFLSWQRLSGVFMSLFTAIPRMTATAITNLGNLAISAGKSGSALERAGQSMRNFGADATDSVMGIGTGPALLITALAVGFGILIDKEITARTAAQHLADSLDSAVGKSTNLQALTVISDSMQKLADESDKARASITRYTAAIPQRSRESGIVDRRDITNLRTAQDAVVTYTAAQKGLQNQAKNVLTGSAALAAQYHTTIPGAMALAEVAGVKLTKSIQGNGQAATEARIKIADLVQGYNSMGAPMSVVGNDMTAVAIQSGLQNTQVQKLTSAWSSYMDELTGGTTGIADFETGLANITSGVASVKDNLSKGGGLGAAAASGTQAATVSVSEFAQDLTNFGTSGSQAWQNFDQVVGQTAPQLINWLTTAGSMGAITGPQFTQAVRDMIAQMLPFAADSSTAAAELGGLVQMAGGPAISSYAQLKRWTDQTKTSTKGLSDIIDGTTIKMGNMSAIAQNLGTVLQTQLTSMMDQARLSASGVQGAIQAYTNDLTNNAENTQKGQADRAGLYGDLMKIFHNSVTANQWIATLTGTVIGNSKTIQDTHESRAQLNQDINNVFKVTPDAYSQLAIYNDYVYKNKVNTENGRAARAGLVEDIVSVGLKAHDSMNDIYNMTAAILNIPKSEAISLVETAVGSWSIHQSSFKIPNPKGGVYKIQAAADGMLVRGGIPGRDSVLIAAMPDELVVPTHIVGSGAVDHLRGHIPGFDGGGVVRASGPGAPAQLAGMAVQSVNDLASQAATGLITAVQQAAMAASAASAGVAGPGGGNAAANQALARQLMPAWATGAQWQAWQALWNQESGWNQLARNPTSGAYGIPQALPPGKMGAAANPPESNPHAQETWGIGYIEGRYTDPLGAWAHERAFSWYDNGGLLPQGLSLALNTTGKPEHVVTAADMQALVGAARGAPLTGDVHITLPEGATVAAALTQLTYQLQVARMQGYAGVNA